MKLKFQGDVQFRTLHIYQKIRCRTSHALQNIVMNFRDALCSTFVLLSICISPRRVHAWVLENMASILWKGFCQPFLSLSPSRCIIVLFQAAGHACRQMAGPDFADSICLIWASPWTKCGTRRIQTLQDGYLWNQEKNFLLSHRIVYTCNYAPLSAFAHFQDMDRFAYGPDMGLMWGQIQRPDIGLMRNPYLCLKLLHHFHPN